MADTTAAATIRRAAQLIRERAANATPGEWYADGDLGVYAYGSEDIPDCPKVFTDHAATREDIEHIAGFGPLVAVAIAEWLDAEADRLEQHIPAWARPSSGVDGPPALCWNNPQRLAELIEHHYGPALAVARAYLAPTSTHAERAVMTP